MTLSAYDYTIAYKPGEQHSNADSLSRLPLPEASEEVPQPPEIVLMMETLQGSPVNAQNIQLWTDRDPVLSRVRNLVLQGWRNIEDEELLPFSRRRDELSVQDGCILWGGRIVVPKAGQAKVLNQLHDSHPGVSKMKGLARGIVWWPGINKDVEERVKSCAQCQQNQKSPAQAPLHPWDWPKRPWARIHIDYAGPFMGKMFLVLVDAHSKWLDVRVVPSATSENTIQKLRSIFATYGIPETLVSDNGSAFTSAEFQEFAKRNGIRHITASPYHPASNGLAERAVQTFKEAMKKSSSGDIETRIARFLFRYRITPHSTTGVPPAELLMGRRPRSTLDLMQPDVATRVQTNQERQKSGHDSHTKARTFAPGDKVFVHNFASGPTWIPGTIAEERGPLSFHIQLENGRVVRQHIDHVRARSCEVNNEFSVDPLPIPSSTSPAERTNPDPIPPAVIPELRRSSRIRQPPNRFTPGLT